MSQPKAPSLTINKVLAGAGAAVTSAVLGSFFGVAGTVVGAAVGSVASTVATTIYERSLDLSRDRILARLRAGSAEGGAPDGGSSDGGSSDGGGAGPPDRPPWRRRGLLGLLGATVLVFLLGMGVVTGVELVKGSSVAGTPGTSVGGVLAPAPTTDPEATDTPVHGFPGPARQEQPGRRAQCRALGERRADRDASARGSHDQRHADPDDPARRFLRLTPPGTAGRRR